MPRLSARVGSITLILVLSPLSVAKLPQVNTHRYKSMVWSLIDTRRDLCLTARFVDAGHKEMFDEACTRSTDRLRHAPSAESRLWNPYSSVLHWSPKSLTHTHLVTASAAVSPGKDAPYLSDRTRVWTMAPSPPPLFRLIQQFGSRKTSSWLQKELNLKPCSWSMSMEDRTVIVL